MHVRRLFMRNFGPFRGEHELLLEPRSYGIAAEYAGARNRSNFAGKSTVLEAVDFALYGRHRHRTEDGWISEGEPDGEVSLETDLCSVFRKRKRGKATTVEMTPEGAVRDEAERLVAQRVGLSAEDFLATCYFQQRQMARLVLARPSERMEMVAAWLRLAPLERAHESLAERLSGMTAALETTRQALRVSQELEARVAEGLLGEDDRLKLEGEKIAQTARLGELESAARRAVEANARAQDVQRFLQVRAEGVKLRAEVDAKNSDQLGAELDQYTHLRDSAAAAASVAKRNLADRRGYQSGAFDGVCPVTCSACPVATDVAAKSVSNRKAVADAEGDLSKLLVDLNECEKARQGVDSEYREHQRKIDRLSALREEATRLLPAYEEYGVVAPFDAVGARSALDEQRAELAGIQKRLDAAESAEKLRERAREEQGRLRAEVARMEGVVATVREAMAIFGPQGAQRRVAEGALSEIEAGANAMLAGCGVDLSVGVSWSREGQGLAKQCGACGTPFPASARAKACARCGGARGPLLVNKLDVVLSDRSGAAEDLAGIALQLSASAWLRRDRGAAWSAVMVDEPFSFCDRANRRSLRQHLGRLLSAEYGFEQAFVISHTSDAEALQGMIRVTRDGKWSRVEVL